MITTAAKGAAFAPWTKKHAFGRFPRNQVVEFPNAGHYFYMEKPDEAARVIDAFLDRLSGSGPDQGTMK